MSSAVAGEAPGGRERPPSPGDDRSPEHLSFGGLREVRPVLRRAAVSFYDDQMTQHAGALTYYGLMSLFPAALLSLSILGLFGEYPRTYDAIVEGLDGLVPGAILESLDASIQHAVEQRGAAAGALALSVAVGFYGITGVLEAARRALNVVFDIECGRGFLRRKAVDVLSAIVLMALIGATLTLLFVGRGLAERILGPDAAAIWGVARWPASLLAASLVFAWLYFVTADHGHRRFRLVTPGSLTGVVAWVALSAGFGSYVVRFPEISALYGGFASAILIVFWLWMTGVCLLFGAEIDAAVERARRARP